MAALNFPNSPTIGDTWPSPPQAGLPTYQWDGVDWVSNFAVGFAYVPLNGATPMTGLLTLSGDPTAVLNAATKQYVDAGDSAVLTGKAVRYDVAQTLTAPQQLQAQQNIGLQLMRSYLAGLTLSTPGASASFTVAAGVAVDSANVVAMALNAPLAKTTAAWAVGAGGALDTGAIANATWYHVFLIRRPDTGVVDVLLSLSLTPTLPTNYTQFRRIGSLLTTASAQWTPFNQFGDYFMWATEAVDASAVASANSSANVALSVPRGLNLRALINIRVNYNTAPGTMTFSSLLVPSSGPGTASVLVGATDTYAQLELMTDTSAQIRVTGNAAGQRYFINTYGWIDTRGKDA